MFDIFRPMISHEPEAAMNNDQPATDDNELLHYIKSKQLYNRQATHHFFVGDESSVELFNALKTVALQNDHEYFGVLELHPEYEAVLSMLKLLVDSVPEIPGQPALNAIHWMEDMHPNCWLAWQNATFYLSGGETLISRFRQYLLKKNIADWQIRIIK
ncbi:hypothetical protein [Longitalea luteola]|uniref:hypothetical protein n=1 Tax=Longitalea luteola TaxID=2812563 RepID=UPI001A9594E6|nr:hypothetical protein [Longitalea luteola]